MSFDPEKTIASLRAALAASPDNVPLHHHLAEVLTGLGRHAEAEKTLRDALRIAPGNAETKLALAACYRAQRKHSAAHVILEDMIGEGTEAARALCERARTLLAEGNVEEAVRSYRRAVDDDPRVEDADLSERLGVRANESFEEASDQDEIVDGRMRRSLSGGNESEIEPVEVDTKFADVGGMDALKKDIHKKIIQPLKNPELYAAYGKKAGGGILLYGPPGCGKTHIARATAGEIDAKFLNVGIHDVLDMWVGQSERNLRDIFQMARAMQPCVLFFDEVDALGASRTDLRQSAGRQTINQFLSELDGLGNANDGLLVLAATNAPWHMDSAFRRPGRFDRLVFVPPPDETSRAAILEIKLRGRPNKDVDLRALAKKTVGFSGADLEAVVEDAIEAKLDEALESGTPVPLTTKDLLTAVKQRKPTTREWFRRVRNHVLYANDDGLYDDIKPYL